MKKEPSVRLSFIAEILIFSPGIQAPALQRSLQELEEVSLITKKLITSVTCFVERKNRKNKIRIPLPLPNQPRSNNRKMRRVLISEIQVNRFNLPLFVIQDLVT